MGLESYNFKVNKKKENIKDNLANILSKREYLAQGSNKYSKRTSSGVIEIEINDLISIRTAVPNHPSIIDEIFYDLSQINNQYELSVYDYQLRIDIDLDDFEVVKEQFTKKRIDFLSFYPHIGYPVSCEEVIEMIALGQLLDSD